MIRDNLDNMIAISIKNGDHLKLDVYRAIKVAFTNFKTAKAHNELTDEVELQIIGKLVAQRKDSIEQYTQANRLDLAEKEQKELEILSSMLPKEPTTDEIENAVKEAVLTLISDNGIEYKPSMKDMKTVMQYVKDKYPMANGGVVSKYFKEMIA